MIAQSKISLLHVAKSQLGLDDSQYRNLLEGAAGVRSSKDLDDAGFDQVVAEFERRGFRSSAKRHAMGARPGMATPRQVKKIKTLWARYAESNDPRALGRWLEKHFHVSDVQFLEGWRAGKAIAVLLKMNEQQPKTKRRKAGAAS